MLDLFAEWFAQRLDEQTGKFGKSDRVVVDVG